MVNRLLVLGTLAYLLLLAGLATLNGPLLALLLPLAVYVGAALLYRPEKPRLRVARVPEAGRVQAGTPITVHLSLTNEGQALEELFVEDILPEQMRVVGGRPYLLTSLAPGEMVEFSYTILPHRGGCEFPGVRVTASEPLGLFRRQANLPIRSVLSVLPETLSLRRVAIYPRRTRGYAGPVPARQGGSGVDFYGVREYQAGDPRRWINWRVSARHPHDLFTNEFEQERIADVGLILDARRRSDMQINGESLFEYAIQATASLARRFLEDGNRVGLLLYGQALDWTFPGYGKIQQERILHALARAQTGDSLVFNRLDYLPTRLFPPRSQLVLISPLCSDDLPMLRRLRARGYELLVIRPDPVSLEVKALASQPGVELAARIVGVERTLLRLRLQQAGICVVDWRVDEPFDRVIHASLSRALQWFRVVGRVEIGD